MDERTGRLDDLALPEDYKFTKKVVCITITPEGGEGAYTLVPLNIKSRNCVFSVVSEG